MEADVDDCEQVGTDLQVLSPRRGGAEGAAPLRHTRSLESWIHRADEGINGTSETFLSAVHQKKPKTLNRDFSSGLNLLVSRDGDTFGFASLVSDTAKALASLKKKYKLILEAIT